MTLEQKDGTNITAMAEWMPIRLYQKHLTLYRTLQHLAKRLPIQEQTDYPFPSLQKKARRFLYILRMQIMKSSEDLLPIKHRTVVLFQQNGTEKWIIRPYTPEGKVKIMVRVTNGKHSIYKGKYVTMKDKVAPAITLAEENLTFSTS